MLAIMDPKSPTQTPSDSKFYFSEVISMTKRYLTSLLNRRS